MSVPYSSVAIANNFLEQFGAQGIEHMKLQKLVYYAYGWWLAEKNARLTTESPEIWQYGPVFNHLYHVFKNFGRQKIFQPYQTRPFDPPENVNPDDDEVRHFVRWIWTRYGGLSSFELSDMTHREGTPWQRVAQENNYCIGYHAHIPDDYIREFFAHTAAIPA